MRPLGFCACLQIYTGVRIRVSVHVIPAAAARVALAHHVMAGKVNGKEFGCEAGLAPQSPVAIPSCIANASPTVSWHALIREAAHNIDIATSAVALDINTGGLDFNTAKQHCQPSLLDVLIMIDIYIPTLSHQAPVQVQDQPQSCAPQPPVGASNALKLIAVNAAGLVLIRLACDHRRRCRAHAIIQQCVISMI